jgi:opacity protein-like surface antigen
MKTMQCAAAAAALVAASHAAAQVGSPQFNQLPLAIQAKMNLGQAGLMRSFFENDQFGTVQWRIGQGRTTVGAATSPGATTTGYADGTSDMVVPISFMHMLPDGQSELLFNLRWTFANGDTNQVELDGGIGRFDVEYLRYPSANMMLGIGAFVEQSSLDIVDDGTIDHDGGGLRVDLLNKFSEQWGLAARAEYSWGNTTTEVPAGPGHLLRHAQGDDRFYTQTEMIGTYHDIAPAGWAMHPILGVQYQRNFLEKTADSFGEVSSGVVGDTEDYGTLWGHLRLEQEVRPGSFSPNLLIGVEHEYVNDLDLFVDEPTYAVLGAGVSITLDKGNRIEVSYAQHYGLNDNRSNQALAAIVSWNF